LSPLTGKFDMTVLQFNVQTEIICIKIQLSFSLTNMTIDESEAFLTPIIFVLKVMFEATAD